MRSLSGALVGTTPEPEVPRPTYASAWELPAVSEQDVQKAMRDLGPQLTAKPSVGQKRKASTSDSGSRKRQVTEHFMSGGLGDADDLGH